MYLYSTIFWNFCLVSIKKSTDVSINTPVALFYICLLYVSTTGISTLSGITAIIRGFAIVRFIGIFSIFRCISVSSAFSGIVVPTMFRFGIVILITGIAVVIVRLVIISELPSVVLSFCWLSEVCWSSVWFSSVWFSSRILSCSSSSCFC